MAAVAVSVLARAVTEASPRRYEKAASRIRGRRGEDRDAAHAGRHLATDHHRSPTIRWLRPWLMLIAKPGRANGLGQPHMPLFGPILGRTGLVILIVHPARARDILPRSRRLTAPNPYRRR